MNPLTAFGLLIVLRCPLVVLDDFSAMLTGTCGDFPNPVGGFFMKRIRHVANQSSMRVDLNLRRSGQGAASRAVRMPLRGGPHQV